MLDARRPRRAPGAGNERRQCEPQIAVPCEDADDVDLQPWVADAATAQPRPGRTPPRAPTRAKRRPASRTLRRLGPRGPSRLDLVCLSAELGLGLGMHDGAAGPSREAAGPGNRLLAPRSSVLKKDSSSPAAPRPVTVTFNLDPSQEQRAAAAGQVPRPQSERVDNNFGALYYEVLPLRYKQKVL